MPWQEEQSSKDQSDLLMDILCDVACHQAEVKACFAKIDHHRILEVKAKVVALHQKLDVWWNNWWPLNKNFCHKQDSMLYSGEEKVFTSSLEYGNVASAYLVATYNTTRILLLFLLQILLKNNGSKTNLNSSPHEAEYLLARRSDPIHQPLCGLSSDIQALAREICQTFEYCNRMSEPRYTCSFSCMIALDTAYSSLDPTSPEARWILSRTRLPTKTLHTLEANSVLAIKTLPSCQLMQDAKKNLWRAHCR